MHVLLRIVRIANMCIDLLCSCEHRAGAPTAAPVPAAAAPGGGAAAAEAVSSRGAWAKLVAPTRREEDELAGLEVPLVLSSAVHDAYAQQALHDVLAEHDAHMRNEFDEH